MDIKKDKVVVEWIVGKKVSNSALDLLLIIVALIVVATSILGLFGQPASEWFARSGSILVLVGAIIEYRSNRFSQIALEESIRWGSGTVDGPTIFIAAWHRVVVKYVAHTFIILGTFIWGYGDKWL